MPAEITFRVSEAEAETMIFALQSSKGDSPPSDAELSLAKRFELQLGSFRFEVESKALAAASQAKHRAAKAAGFVITKRMAECLFVVSQGRYVSARVGRHRGGSMMGGATKRMAYELIEHGLLLDFSKITPEGLAKLDEWQRENKPFVS